MHQIEVQVMDYSFNLSLLPSVICGNNDLLFQWMAIYCFGRQIGLNFLETEARIYLRTGCIRYTL